MATTNKGLEQPAYASAAWDVPMNANSGYLDAALGSKTALSSVTGTVVLTLAQYRNAFFGISGTLTGNLSYSIPAGVGGQWTYDTTGLVLGSYTARIISGGGGTTVTLAANTTGIVFCDGTNVKSSVPTTTTPPAGSVGALQYNDSGVFGGSSSVSFNGTTGVLTVDKIAVLNAVQVQYGGTGATTLPFGYALVGNGTSAVSSVAPGTSGNVLTSNGSTWVSQAWSGVTSWNGQTGAVWLTTADIVAQQPMGLGDRGTYAMLYNNTGSAFNPGDTTAGSNLVFAAADGNTGPGTQPSGTWKCMGYSAATGNGATSTTLWLRTL